ncbi:hypothetical protein NJC40_01865 [Pseudomonas sp. 21LCFQ02]|uniref:hypothetical protein n=1 Tax=unclassified Pseudomonas TaxID=196821 RepID=UPI0004F8F8CA|nr:MULTISPECIES: hypothetical protein [unclassified Pseudomonas]MCO8166522.1 hypothetical protein [Pseudomonas sp. 21LCFQ02]MCQ9422462.1 hypothetical protein [Pseudomonas sp. LJDD11]BAP43643.1 hypothetical protein PSCI_2941 [Pseudomonas sp. StFLB209]
MSDPLNKATASPPPVIGEGCLSRYDPDALSPEDGADFSAAAQLWRQLQEVSNAADNEPHCDTEADI